MTYAESDLVASIERLTGGGLAALTQDQRDQFDQFHAGGSEAVDRISSSLNLATGMTVLDVGSGFGGPARQVARSTGCTVVGVDITPAYVEAAQELTFTAGLSEQVRFFCCDIAAFDRIEFDAAYTMHVQMNVEDKKTFFAEIAHRLRPGARFATYEVCLSSDAERTAPPLSLPLPWSIDGTDSFLAPADELRDTIRSSGFDLVEWVDETAWVNQWFDDLGSRIAAGASGPTLPALLAHGPTRMLNFAAALSAGALSVHRGAFVVAGE
jgi:sarcosine/dimethylglycine N-methyltransferase